VDLRRACGPDGPRAAGAAEYLQWLGSLERDSGQLLAHVRDLLVQHSPDVLSGSPAALHTLGKIHKTAGQAVTTLGVVLPAERDDNVDDTRGTVDLDDLSQLLTEFDDPGLFTTDITSRPAPAVDDDPAAVLLRRLAGYVQHSSHRGTLAALRRYALHPGPANSAMSVVTRELPADHLVAASVTAALFVRAGTTPLPRLARSFGGSQRGPQHPAVRNLITRAVRTPADRLLPVLLQLIRYAARVDALLDWTGLYNDVVHWDDSDKRARTRWMWLFSYAHPIADIDKMLAKGSTP
jgi:hypothetical protein